jgi:ferric-dicitrate binding protein FerR (iron transport regulator)
MGTNTIAELVYNEMVVPYGKRFQVTLSDGTQVHLNSGTSFKFPVKFIAGRERKVFLKGEAFFDVVKNKKDAFVINSKDIDIKVLGTKFNVSYYTEDEEINTVLVTGSVQIYESSKPSFTKKIQPGQMASWNKEQKNIYIEDVDIDLHTAWMEGRLILRKTPFKVIRKKLERYYNVSIINHNELLDRLYYNINFDNETIEQVLKTLNENFDIDYRINDNTIIIN